MATSSLDGRMVDVTRLDPSIAGAAGGSALVTTVQDRARFWDALLKGRLYRRRGTLKAMLTFGPIPGEVTSGYGLGVKQYTIPGGIELIGHLGGAGTYRSFVGRQRPQGVYDRVRAELPGRPVATHLPGGEDACGDAPVTRAAPLADGQARSAHLGPDALM